MAAWLNYAKGNIGWTELVDTNGDGTPNTEFGALITEVEDILNKPTADMEDLERAKDLAEAVGKRDKNNPGL